MIRPGHVIVAALLGAAAGCDLTYQPDVGPLSASAPPFVDAAPGAADGAPVDPDGDGDAGMMTVVSGPCADSDPSVDVSFADEIRPLMYRSPGGCSCHSSNTTSGFNLGSYDRLRKGGLNSGEGVIVPFKPCESILVQKLGLAPPFGARMPYNGPPYFTAEELTLVKDWIAEGAANN